MSYSGRTTARIEVTIGESPAERERSLAHLRAALVSIPTGHAEIWVDHSPFPSLCALINGQHGWLMCIRYDGDAGFSSRNPTYAGPSDAEIHYELSNGQRDRYPAAWAYPTTGVLRAVEFFAHHGRVPGSIAWWNDPEDGAHSPNDPTPNERQPERERRCGMTIRVATRPAVRSSRPGVVPTLRTSSASPARCSGQIPGTSPRSRRRSLEDEAGIRRATITQIRTMLTYCVRGERFCDGHWETVLKSGRVVALLRRLGALRIEIQ